MKPVSPIPEISPGDSVTALCQQLSQGLSQLTHSGSDDFNFNSQTSINQNVALTINTSSINSMSTTSGFSPNLTTPIRQPQSVTPVNLNYSNHSPCPSVDSSGSGVGALPRPEQWLGQIVSSATPVRDAESASPRRTPLLGPHSRTMSLGSAESFGRLPQVDPFDAEWAAIATRQENGGPQNTNPFLVNSSAPQPFQVQL